MQEITTPALVLARYPSSEKDLSVTLFTRDLGKISAKAISAQKMTSKLAGHLDVGFVSSVRIVEQNTVRVVDALRVDKKDFSLGDLLMLDRILPLDIPELSLWKLLRHAEMFPWKETLKILGWDPTNATCSNNHTSRVLFFHIESSSFLCDACVEKRRLVVGEVIDCS